MAHRPAAGQPGIPGIEDLCRELTGAGVGREHAAALETAARRPTPWWSSAGGDLPVQVIHADLGASNTLVDEHTGQVTALLDFELAGPDYRVQDLVAALLLSGALEGPQWRRRVAALARGHVRALRLDPAEIQAIPDLLVCRGLGSVLWRVARWRRGQARLGDVTGRLDKLDATLSWLAAHSEQLLDVMACAG